MAERLFLGASFVALSGFLPSERALSFYEGIAHVMRPTPIQTRRVNYVVLALSTLFDGCTWWVALRNFKGEKSATPTF